MKTSPGNKKISELITGVQSGSIILKPPFQRRLVWSRDDKNKFIETILKGLPFPEIYICHGSVDITTGSSKQLIVDGQQRATTIIQYFTNSPDFKYTIVPPYSSLSEKEKEEFLMYDIAVRDLGNIDYELIVEVFSRINATKYSLDEIEINNAMYNGKIKKYCERLIDHTFFNTYSVFNSADYKRMGDLKFILTIVSTMIVGYFNRDEELANILERYNDDFLIEEDIDKRLNKIFEYLIECNIDQKCRLFKKADLFSNIVEMDALMQENIFDLNPSEYLSIITDFYNKVDIKKIEDNPIVEKYYFASIQATNDRGNRILRGKIISDLLQGKQQAQILQDLA